MFFSFWVEIFLNNQKNSHPLVRYTHTHTEICMMRQYFHLSLTLYFGTQSCCFFFPLWSVPPLLLSLSPNCARDVSNILFEWNSHSYTTDLVLNKPVGANCYRRFLPQLASNDSFFGIINVNFSFSLMKSFSACLTVQKISIEENVYLPPCSPPTLPKKYLVQVNFSPQWLIKGQPSNSQNKRRTSGYVKSSTCSGQQCGGREI